MTLLESVLALAILGLTATGILGAYQGALRSSREASAWVTAVAYAESAMESTKLGVTPVSSSTKLPDGYREEVSVREVPNRPLKRIQVRVTLPDGREFVIERIAEL